MRERLLAAREVWLCWNCRDCSDTCPRKARPSEYVEAARRYAIASLDPSGISRLMYTSSAFVVVFALALAALLAGVLLSQASIPPDGPLALFVFIPFELIHNLGILVLVLVGLLALFNLYRLVGRIYGAFTPPSEESTTPPATRTPLSAAAAATRALVDEMARQDRFRQCEVEAERPWFLRPWFVHYAIMWGFIGLGLATALDFLFKVPGSMVPLWYPPRLLGTIAGLALMYGSSVTILRKLRPVDETQARPLASDWLFLGLLFAVGLSGFLLEVMVYLPRVGSFGYATFVFHVALAMELLVLLPFTKFAHALYRPLAYWIYHFRLARAAQSSAIEASD